MFSLYAIGMLYIIFFVAGFCIALAVTSWGLCDKSSPDPATSAKYAAICALFPALVYAIMTHTNSVSEYIKKDFSGGIQYIFGKIGSTTDDERFVTLGITYALILTGFVTTTYMIHQLNKEVCKPTVDELASFEENLLKTLKKEPHA
jgi:hypothetical protein